jgi:hypothetical protein
MKVYENIDNIAQADSLEIAERCKISKTAALAVRAAAKLAVEDQQTEAKRLIGSKQKQTKTNSLAAEAAADIKPDYEPTDLIT